VKPTPYGLVQAAEQVKAAGKHELVVLSRELEQVALSDPPPLMVATLQDHRYVTPRTREIYRRLAQAGTHVTLHARGLHGWLDPGVQGVDLTEDDPLVHEWVVVVPSRVRPAVLAATDLDGASVDDDARNFSYAVSYDPQLVAACAALLT